MVYIALWPAKLKSPIHGTSEFAVYCVFRDFFHNDEVIATWTIESATFVKIVVKTD